MGKKDKPRDIEGILRVTTKLEVASFIGANVLLFGVFFICLIHCGIIN